MIPLLGGPMRLAGEPTIELDPVAARIAEHWRKRRNEMLVEWARAALAQDELREARCPAR